MTSPEIVAVIGLVGVLGAALIANWHKIFHPRAVVPPAIVAREVHVVDSEVHVLQSSLSAFIKALAASNDIETLKTIAKALDLPAMANSITAQALKYELLPEI